MQALVPPILLGMAWRNPLQADAEAVRPPIDYQIAPAFPRLFTYGVRFKF